MRSSRLAGLALLFLPACEMGKLFDSPPAAGESAHGGATADAVKLTFTVQPGTVKVGDAITPSVAVAAQDSAGTTVATFTGPITVVIDVGPGGALSGDLTQDAAGGVSTFPNLTVDQKGTGYRLKASAPGLTDATSTPFEVLANDGGGGGQQPTGITLASGDGQVDTVGASLVPYVVLVTDASSNGVAGVTVRWGVTGGGGSITATSSTDATGHARATRTLGNALGRQTATATVTGLAGSPVAFAASAIPGAAATLAFTVQPSGAAAGNAIAPPIEVTARDRLGNTATGFSGTVTLALQTNPVGGVLSGAAARAAASGIATFAGLSIDRGGAYTLSAHAAGIPDAVSGAFFISPIGGSAASMAPAAGTGQTDTAAARLPVAYQVRVTDGGGNPVAGMAVTWTVATGGGSISPGSSLTDAGGLAQSTHTLGTAAGVQTVSASAAAVGGSPVTFTATALPATASQLVILTQPTNPGTGATIAPAVSVAAVDRFGNRATNQPASVTAGIVPLSGTPLATLSGTLTRPLTAGVATFDDLKVSLPGLGYRLRLTTGALSVESDLFNVL